jgi:Protein of unknown function (DUF3592)
MLSFALGVLALMGGMGFGLWNWNLMQSGVRTVGTVVEVAADKDGMFHPVFMYLDEKGAEQRVRSTTGRVPAGFAVGEKVPVIYQKGQAQSGVIATFWEMWFAAIVCVGLGVMWIGARIALGIVERVMKGKK